MLKNQVFRVLAIKATPVHRFYLFKPLRNMSFIRLTENMEVRKKMLPEIREANEKSRKQSMPFYKRIQEYAQNNKKKIIFFIVVCAVMNYYDGYKKFLKYVRSIESLKRKLRRWFLGEDNYIPDSLKETMYYTDEVKLSIETINVISNLFLQSDKVLQNGMCKRFLVKMYSNLGMFQDKKERTEFYFRSTYRRKKNQKLAGVSLKEFLEVFQEMLKKAQKKDSSVTEEAFLQKVIDNWEQVQTNQHQSAWETNLLSRFDEDRKANAIFQSDKAKFIKDRTTSNPKIKVDELDKELKQNGFFGLSLKEKILLLEFQIMMHSVEKTNLLEKMEKEIFAHKQAKQLEKTKNLDAKLEDLQAELNRYKEDFNRYFNKPEKSKENVVST